mmetsp:Transcript_10022/g.20899  ORF Transcript_10022/g.20899 Transcript_10022/m.20899 type:complete len:328 (+) Transcript_10022:458-1441(+)
MPGFNRGEKAPKFSGHSYFAGGVFWVSLCDAIPTRATDGKPPKGPNNARRFVGNEKRKIKHKIEFLISPENWHHGIRQANGMPKGALDVNVAGVFLVLERTGTVWNVVNVGKVVGIEGRTDRIVVKESFRFDNFQHVHGIEGLRIILVVFRWFQKVVDFRPRFRMRHGHTVVEFFNGHVTGGKDAFRIGIFFQVFHGFQWFVFVEFRHVFRLEWVWLSFLGVLPVFHVFVPGILPGVSVVNGDFFPLFNVAIRDNIQNHHRVFRNGHSIQIGCKIIDGIVDFVVLVCPFQVRIRLFSTVVDEHHVGSRRNKDHVAVWMPKGVIEKNL